MEAHPGWLMDTSLVSPPPGPQRTSVFDRLGAEIKVDTTVGSKVSGRTGLGPQQAP